MDYLLDIDNLLRLKSSITPENYVNYIDALCEKLVDTNYNLTQICEVLNNFELSDYSVELLEMDIQGLFDKISELEYRVKELENAK